MAAGGSGVQAVGMEKKWWTLVVVCAATFMLLLDITIVIVALPTIQSELHASQRCTGGSPPCPGGA